MEKKKLGLPSVISTSVGLIVATSCLLSLGRGAGTLGVSFIIPMVIACAINICTALSMAELNAIMPNLTGGLAQYSLAGFGPFITIVTMVGGYLVCQAIAGSVECAMFGNAINTAFNTNIPSSVFCIILLILLIIANLMGVDVFAKVQNIVAYGLIGSLIIMGIMGIVGLSTGEKVVQEMNLAESSSPHILYGQALLGTVGSLWMISYVISNINVLIFRVKMPKVPRTFKVPFGWIIPIIGAAGSIFMIINIDSDPATRATIYLIDGIIFVVLAVYAVLWIKLKMKAKLFKPIPIEQVMVTENEIYQVIRQREREEVKEERKAIKAAEK